MQLSRQLSLPMFIHDGKDLRLVKTDACIQELQSTCSSKKKNGVEKVQNAWANIVCAKLTAEEVCGRALVSHQLLASWAADPEEGEDNASIMESEFGLSQEGMAAPIPPPSPEPAQEHWLSQNNWQWQNNWDSQKRRRQW